MDLTEKTIKKNYIYQGKILSLRCDDVLNSNGLLCKREIVEHNGGACVLYIKDDKVLLVKQFRYAFGESIYELPAGKLNAGEDPMESARRELEEETGIQAKELKHLYTYYPTTGYSSEKIYVYQALDGIQGKAHLDEGEFLNVEYLPVEKVKKMIDKGEIKDSKTIIGILHYLLENKK